MQRTTLLSPWLAAALALATGLLGCAADPYVEVEEPGFDYDYDYAGWDLDDDGYIDEAEFDDGVYASWDRDSDGRLEEDEYVTGDFVAFDRDGDGCLDDDELDLLYDDWDHDGDGHLDDDELL
jgi:hypothetical protein